MLPRSRKNRDEWVELTRILLSGQLGRPLLGLIDIVRQTEGLLVGAVGIVVAASLMESVGKEKVSDVARTDGDELCEVIGGAVPVGRVLCDQAHVEESGGKHRF